MQCLLFKFDEMDGTSVSNVSTDIVTVEIDGEPWFVATDVCNLLGLSNTSAALSSLDPDERIKAPIFKSGQNRNVNLISESGLYSLVFSSKKPFAKKFAKWITKEVIPSIRRHGMYSIDRSSTPNFVIRFNDNWDRTGQGYFSVISELYIRLYGRFHQIGYDIPDKAFSGKEIRPDVSVGKCFSRYLRENYPEFINMHKPYLHKFPNGMEIEARQYENSILLIFIKYIDEEWIPKKAEKYFMDRDRKALDFLPKILPPAKKAV